MQMKGIANLDNHANERNSKQIGKAMQVKKKNKFGHEEEMTNSDNQCVHIIIYHGVLIF